MLQNSQTIVEGIWRKKIGFVTFFPIEKELVSFPLSLIKKSHFSLWIPVYTKQCSNLRNFR